MLHRRAGGQGPGGGTCGLLQFWEFGRRKARLFCWKRPCGTRNQGHRMRKRHRRPHHRPHGARAQTGGRGHSPRLHVHCTGGMRRVFGRHTAFRGHRPRNTPDRPGKRESADWPQDARDYRRGPVRAVRAIHGTAPDCRRTRAMGYRRCGTGLRGDIRSVGRHIPKQALARRHHRQHLDHEFLSLVRMQISPRR